MKKHNLKYTIVLYLLVISTLVTFTSCSKLVDIDSPTTQIEKTEVFNDISTIKAALNNLYLSFSTSPAFDGSNAAISFNLSLFTDELDYYGTNQVSKDIYLNTISDTNSTITNWWNNIYQDIYAINAFIEGVNNSSVISLEQKKSFLGEAYALRAIYYQYLAQLYGDIPYTTSTNYTYNKNIGKSPYSDVLRKIEEDLNNALEYLDYTNRSNNKFYINKAVAELIIIENYILQEKYEKAQNIAESLLDKNIYKIEDDLNNTFKKEAKSTLWQLSPFFISANSPTSEAALYLFSNFTTHSAVISNTLLKLFEEQDKRIKQWTNKITLNEKEYYQVYKYKKSTNNTDEFSIVFRIEQVYHDYAYALIMQGKTTQTIEILNYLRQKRGLEDVPTTLNKQEIITALLEESSKEFFTENGRRFFSLKIADKLNHLTESKPNFKPYHKLLPIPYRQLEINSNLLPNNPGY